MAYLGHKPAVGENNSFRILDDISSFVLTFDGSSASVVGLSDETITVTENNHRFITGQRVTYSNGGGGNITGLSNGQAYFVINHSKTQIKLASSASNALAGTAVNLTGLGTGSSHTLTLAFDGVNTKFDPTFGDGMHDTLIKRAAQLVISINGVIQQPHDTATPSTGFGVDALGNIIFSTPPASTDIFWGHILATNTVTFDSSDNDVDTFTGNGSTTSFTLSKTPPDNRNILVTIDGVVQYPSDAANTRSYSVSENVMTFVAAPGNGTVIQVRHIGYAGVSAGGGGGVTGFYGRTGNVSLVSTDNIVANNATFSGNVSIAQTLTYEDVTNMDVVGVATFNSDVFIADSIRHTGDTDSKIRFPDQGQFSFETNGYERFKFTETDATLLNYQGNHKVGIGTDVLVAKLDVKNNFNGPVLKLNDSHMNKYMTVRGGGSPNRMIIDAYEGGGGGAAIDFASNGSTKVRITSAGILEIDRGSAVDEALDIDTTATTGASRIRFNESGSNKGQLAYSHANDQIELIGTSGNAAAIFTDGTERVKVTSAGKFHVGITTSSDNYVWTPRARFATESSGDASSIHFGGSTNPAIVMLRRGGSASWVHHAGRIYTDHRPAIHFQTAYASATDSHSFQHHMTMKYNVGVGIGTVDPTGLLDINSASGTYDHLRMRRTASGSGNSDWSLKPYAGNLYFRTAGANDHIVFTSDAKVGINTTSPADVLDINSSQASAVSDVYIRNHANLGGAALNIWTQGTYAAPTYKAIIGCSDAGGTIRMGSASNHDLLLLVNNSPKLTIKTSGRVNVGSAVTSDPWNKTGDVETGVVLQSTTTSYGIAVNSKDIVGIFNRTNSSGTIVEYKYNGSVVGETVTNATDLELKSTADLRLTASGGEVIVTGKVGISEASPQSILDVKSDISTHPLGAIFRKDYGGDTTDASHKVALTIWGQDHNDLDHTGQDAYGPMIGFGARNDDSVPNTGDIRAAISYRYNGNLTFHTEAGGSITDGSNESLRITSKGTTIAYHGAAPTDALTYSSSFRGREGVISPIYYWPRAYASHSNGGGYDDVAEGGRLTLRLVGATGGTAAMFNGGFGVTYGGGGEGIEYNRVRVIFRVTRANTTDGYNANTITFKMQSYYYTGGWTDISNSSWNFNGTDSERGYRWTASNWIASSDFAGGFDVPSIAIKYDTDNGNLSNDSIRIAAVYLQYARFS